MAVLAGFLWLLTVIYALSAIGYTVCASTRWLYRLILDTPTATIPTMPKRPPLTPGERDRRLCALHRSVSRA